MTTEQKLTMEKAEAFRRLKTLDKTSQEAAELRACIVDMILYGSKMTIGELAEEVSE